MNAPSFAVDDRVRLRYPGPFCLPEGTVTKVFGTAPDYYDVQLDTERTPRVCHASDIERITAGLRPTSPFWIDDAGHQHVAPNMHNLPPLLQLGIKRMRLLIAASTVTIRKGSQLPEQQQEQQRAQAAEAVDILLCILLTRLSQAEIDRHPYNEKRHFVERWFELQTC